MYNNNYSELYHFGIKGQKWGVRRWQNEDGSLTPEGYEHYGRKLNYEKKKSRSIRSATNWAKGSTDYEWESSKYGAALTGTGLAALYGTSALSAGYAATESALLALGAGTGGAAGYMAATALSIAGRKVMIYLLNRRVKRSDKRIKKYEAARDTYKKKKKIAHSDIDELYHFGILGQKWGVRRWQNKDGSLTPEGYEHYGRKNNNSNKVQRLVRDYEANEYIKRIDKSLALSGRYGGKEPNTGIYFAKKGDITVTIPNDHSDETITKLKKNFHQAEKDIKDIRLNLSKILDDDYKKERYNEGYTIGYPKPSNNIYATVRKDGTEYSIGLIDDHDGEYIGETPIKKVNGGWTLKTWRELEH